jgi:SAM-dependent methyltransferase
MTPTADTYSCAACNHGRLLLLFTGTDRNQKTGTRRYAIVRCGNCGLVQTTPRPGAEDFAAMYPPQYYPALVSQDAPRESQHDKVGFVRRQRPSGRLLDVGAGIGLFVREAIDAGYDARGLEISAQAVETGTAALKIPLACGDFLTAEIPASDCDIVTFWHVFEHLADARAILAKVHRILRPSGLVIIAVPNFESVQSKVFRSHWYHIDIPRHLFHYTPRTLGAIVEQCGFTVQDVGYGWREHDRAGILGSLMRLSPPGEHLLHKAVRKLAGIPVAGALARLESSMHSGGAFALVATKK